MTSSPIKFTPLDYLCINLSQESVLTNTPLFRYALFKFTKQEPTKKEPDLLESLNIFGTQIATVALGVSLWSWSVIPAVCSGALILIFKKTLTELQKRQTTTEKIEELSAMLKASNISAEGIKAMTKKLENLADKHQNLLEDYQKTQKNHDLAVQLLEFTCQKFSKNGDELHKKLVDQCTELTKQVTRLSSVGTVCISCLKTIAP